MPAPHTYDYAVIRVVPRVEREEFLNAGIIVSCPSAHLLEARIELDESRLAAFSPDVDVEALRGHLATIPAICAGHPDAGPIARLPARKRFHWLTAQRSAIIQMSPVHSGRCEHPARLVDHLLERMVRPARSDLRGPDSENTR